MVRVNAVLDSWKAAHQDTALAVEEFPSDDFDCQPVSDVMSFHEMASHILEAGHGLTGLLLAGACNSTAPAFWAQLEKHFAEHPHSSSSDFAPALPSEARCGQLVARMPAFFSGIIARFDGRQVTALEMLQTIKEQLTHRAGMFMCLRFKGPVPATTRRLLSEAKA